MVFLLVASMVAMKVESTESKLADYLVHQLVALMGPMMVELLGL